MVIKKTNKLMLQRETVSACSENHTKHRNILCGQKVKFLCAKPGII
jgi:hypothetical protein